jgi:hypothetical protein
VIPFLERHDTPAKILAACAAGDLSEAEAFGVDPGWRNFNHGFAQASAGDVAAAITHFQEVITSWSRDPYDWVRRRKAAAQAYVDQLQGQAVDRRD